MTAGPGPVEPVRLPWGKHKGLPLAVVPTPYLSWVVAQEWLQSPLCEQVRDELHRREISTAPAATALPATVGARLAGAIVDAGKRALAEQAANDPALLLALDATATLLGAWALDQFAS